MAPLPPLKQSTNDLAPAWLKSPSSFSCTNTSGNKSNATATTTSPQPTASSFLPASVVSSLIAPILSATNTSNSITTTTTTAPVPFTTLSSTSQLLQQLHLNSVNANSSNGPQSITPSPLAPIQQLQQQSTTANSNNIITNTNAAPSYSSSSSSSSSSFTTSSTLQPASHTIYTQQQQPTLISNGSGSSSSSVWDGNVKIKVLSNPINKFHRYYRSRVLINRLEASTTVNNSYFNNSKQSTALPTPIYNGNNNNQINNTSNNTSNNTVNNNYNINNNHSQHQQQQQHPLHHERKDSMTNGHRAAPTRHYQVQQQQQLQPQQQQQQQQLQSQQLQPQQQQLQSQQQQQKTAPQKLIQTFDTNYNQHNYLKYRQHTITAPNSKIKSAWSDDDGSSDENEEDDLSDEHSLRQDASESKTSDANNSSNSDTTSNSTNYRPGVNGTAASAASSEPIVISNGSSKTISLNSSTPYHHKQSPLQGGTGCYKNGFHYSPEQNKHHLRHSDLDDLDGALSRSPMSEEERRLLRTMGWKEDGDDDLYAPLTDDEVQEFVERFKKLQTQNGTTSSNKLIKANTSLNRRLASDKNL